MARSVFAFVKADSGLYGLDPSNEALARRMQAAGEPAATIAKALGVSRATVYLALAEE